MTKLKYTIRERKDGSYEGRVTINGKRYSRYGKTMAEVKVKMKLLEREYCHNNLIADNIRLRDAMQAYLEDIKKAKVKATTYDRAESTFTWHIKDESIGRMQVASITAQDVQRLLLEKGQKGMSTSSIKKIYTLLGEFFRYATASKIIASNPMELVTMPHASNIIYQEKEMEVLTADEVRRVIEVAERLDVVGNPVYRYGEAIILLFLTGMRSGELRALHKSAIDLENKVLVICKNETYSKDRKNGGIVHTVGDVKTRTSNRAVPLNDRAMVAIRRLLKNTCNHDTGYLVCTSKGNIVTHNGLLRSYTHILKAAGVKNMGLHSTRHTFATVVLKDAEDKGQIKEVSELLGHSKVSTTYQYYIKTSDKDKRNLLNQLDNLVS